MGVVADGIAAGHAHSIVGLDGAVSGSNIAVRAVARLL
jgi:hypothetical protein